MLTSKSINNRIRFDFPNVHPEAFCALSLRRALRGTTADSSTIDISGGTFPIVGDGGHYAFAMLPSEVMWMSFHPSYYPFAVPVSFGGWDSLTGLPDAAHLTENPKNYFVLPRVMRIVGLTIRDSLVWRVVELPWQKTVDAWQTNGMSGGIVIRLTPMKRDAFPIYYGKLVEAKLDAFRYMRRNHVLGEKNLSSVQSFRENDTIDALVTEQGIWDENGTKTAHLNMISVAEWKNFSIWNQSSVVECFETVCAV